MTHFLALVPEKTIGRLTLYRRIVSELAVNGVEFVHSHHLALRSGGTAAQVRRDLMVVGAEGNPKKGYRCSKLLDNIGRFLDQPGGQKVALLGVGNLGRALLSYFIGRRPGLQIVAAFDTDPQKVNRVIHGCRCHPLDDLERIMKREHIKVVVIAAPANTAQYLGDRAALAGATGILNFAPLTLQLPRTVFVENLDVTMSLEKVAFFASKRT